MDSALPSIDPSTRRRLTARFGGDIEAWFDRLPGLLTALAQRWQLELGSPIPREHVGRRALPHADGRPAVLKASPGRARLAFEAAALQGWHTVHSPRCWRSTSGSGRC
jgi:hypothetical protein